MGIITFDSRSNDMTEAVKELLRGFDALTDAEKQEATVQLLRRAIEDESGRRSGRCPRRGS
jgi:hypothetical protein